MKSTKWSQSIQAAEMLLKIEQAGGSIDAEKLIAGEHRTRKVAILFALSMRRSVTINEDDTVTLNRKPSHETQATDASSLQQTEGTSL